MTDALLADHNLFTAALYEVMLRIEPAIAGMDLREFRYAMENITPAAGWDAVMLPPAADIDARLADMRFFQSIQLKPKVDGRPVLDETILALNRALFVGLVSAVYPPDWVCERFFFDARAFSFMPRVRYFSSAGMQRLGGRPYCAFEPKQRSLSLMQSLGYQAFKAANAEVDACFMRIIATLAERQGTPLLIAIAGQTAAGKTEIVARLREAFEQAGKSVTAIELDNFFLDRDYREASGLDSLGSQAMHFDLLLQALNDILHGRRIVTPRYDFITATSSHDLDGHLRPGCQPVVVEPADIIFMEGNFPFLLPELVPLIGIKAMYLTDDAVRMKRKWKRDMDIRKKYDLYYFINRYFREQYLMAQQVYIPQIEACDILVDTTGAAVWVTPGIERLLDAGQAG